MANAITKEKIRQINQLYYEYHNYAKIGRELGIGATTVKKYVDSDYAPIDEKTVIRFNPEKDMPSQFITDMFMEVENFGDLCILTEEEKEGIEILHGEMEI